MTKISFRSPPYPFCESHCCFQLSRVTRFFCSLCRDKSGSFSRQRLSKGTPAQYCSIPNLSSFHHWKAACLSYIPYLKWNVRLSQNQDKLCLKQSALLVRSYATKPSTKTLAHRLAILPYSFSHFYRPQTKLRKGNIYRPQGNVFTPVCDSVHTPRQTPPQADTPPQAESPLPRRRALQWTIRIILECILVSQMSVHGGEGVGTSHASWVTW